MKMNLILLGIFIPNLSFAEADLPKGLLSEIRLVENNEDLNLKRSFDSEVLISKSEKMAIESLKKIIQKKRGTREEADLMYRLAELYMRLSRSGHFFDLDRDYADRLKRLGLDNQKSKDSLRQAVHIYDQILARFPNFNELDNVLFNNALAESQINNIEKAKKHYLALIHRFPNSGLVPDSHLEVGELFYRQQNFQTALNHFKDIENYPDSQAYAYGLYKSAWCYYNLKNTDDGIKQLLHVVKENPAGETNKRKYNLRKEALNDLILFVGEALRPDQVYNFFDKICTREELGDIMVSLSGLYESHSRFQDIAVFSEQFIKAHPESTQAARLYTKLVESLETLKRRDQVIKKLADMAEFCREHESNAQCKEEFKNISLEISKKWWEIWLKNKTNTEFSNLTERAFQNLLSLDTLENPDSKSRYAFAELLFQQNKFAEAAAQYEQISIQKRIEPELAHDSLYAALFSIERLLTQKEEATLIEKQKQLALRYYSEFKSGEHRADITYKLGFIAYQQKQYDLALTYLVPLSENKKNAELGAKAEDAMLDIYNIKKDYVTIQKLSQKLLLSNPKNERAESLRKIGEEAHYTQIQIDVKNSTPLEQIEALLSFGEKHRGSPLAQQALWQAIATAFSKNYDVKGAELSLDYIRKFPEDTRKNDLLRDAVRAFIDSARFEQALVALKLLQDEARICEVQQLLDANSARNCYVQLFKKSDRTQKAHILSQLPQLPTELQNQVLQEGIEPYATQILIGQANILLNKGDYPRAFAMSLKINGRSVHEDVRAGARLIQARILEGEFTAQSVRARADKLSLVIAMKVEKFEKCLTAYSSVLKMTEAQATQTETQLAALQGIDRLYIHFISALNGSGNAELASLTTPFIEKQKANQESLNQLMKLSKKISVDSTWPEAEIRMPAGSAKAWYLIDDVDLEKKTSRIYSPTGRCDVNNFSLSSLNSCLISRDYKSAEQISLHLTVTPKDRAVGLYYLSLIAEAKNQKERSLWLAEKAFEQNKKFALPLYQKARLKSQVGG